MKLLAFDTSTAQGSVAVLERVGSDIRILAQREWRRAQSHSEFLTAEIEIALQEAHLKATDLDALAVGQGPGSFTGIRVSINAARALGYALAKPVYTFTTAETLVEPIIRTDLPVLAIINAQKNSFFVARFRPQASSTSPSTSVWSQDLGLTFMTLNELEAVLTDPCLCIGDGCGEAELALRPGSRLKWIRDPHQSDFPLAASLGRLALRQRKSSGPYDWNAIQPLYIRASGAEENLREGSKKA